MIKNGFRLISIVEEANNKQEKEKSEAQPFFFKNSKMRIVGENLNLLRKNEGGCII